MSEDTNRSSQKPTEFRESTTVNQSAIDQAKQAAANKIQQQQQQQ